MNHEIIKKISVLNEQEYLNDGRLSEVYNTNYRYDLKNTYESLESWEKRKKEIKEQVLFSSGLMPEPVRSPLNAKVFDRIEFEDFFVEKVLFESYPGIFVSGNLYTPKGKAETYPAILNPHGHWPEGRFEQSDLCDVPLRCANFAKIGFIAFTYDMVGYNNSDIDHNIYFPQYHNPLNQTDELWGISLFGLQLWNSIRCVDFLISLDNVDPERVGCTGASGGGTQTFFLTVVDDRIKVSMPVNMISESMQGSCICENAPDLRIDTNNVEISAAIAPRPMMVVGCSGDWTNMTPQHEFPFIKSVYKLYGAEDNVDLFFQKAEHNYDKNTREAAYMWFNRQFYGKYEQIKEVNVDLGDVNRFRIIQGSDEENMFHESRTRELFDYLIKIRKDTLLNLHKEYNRKNMKVLKKLLCHALGISNQKIVCFLERKDIIDSINASVRKLIIGTKENGENIPIVMLFDQEKRFSDKAVLFIHSKGKKAVFEDKTYTAHIQKFIDEGYTIAIPDVFLTGEYNHPSCIAGRNYALANFEKVNFFTTFNYTDSAYRVQDIYLCFNYLREQGYKDISLIGIEEGGYWSMAAIGILDGLNRAFLDMRSLSSLADEWYKDNFFIPHFFTTGGFEISLRLNPLEKLTLFNSEERGFAELVKKIYTSLNIPDSLEVVKVNFIV